MPASMSRRTKKGGKRKTKTEPPARAAAKGAPAEDVRLMISKEVRLRNFAALKLELLGPFLFGQSTLCSAATEMWQKEGLLEPGETSLPVFFGRDKWEGVRRVVATVQVTLKVAEEDKHFFEFKHMFLGDGPAAEINDLMMREMAKSYSLSPLKARDLFSYCRCHVIDFAKRVHRSANGEVMSSTLTDKEKLIGPVKDRGNTNFKQDRYKAAIGDYTTAIKLCPFNPILYCNRAMCYLRNEEYWPACLDSYRAVVLRPGWEKAYYRCAEAWAKLGEPEVALTINREGLRECTEVGDLHKQSAELRLDRKEPWAYEPDENGMIRLPKTLTTTEMADLMQEIAEKEVKKRTEQMTAEKQWTEKKEQAQPQSAKSSEKKSSDQKSSEKKSSDQKSSEKKSSDQKSSEKKSSEQKSSEPKKAPSKKVHLFTGFESLTCPLLTSPQVTVSSLKSLGKKVELQYYQPSAYFSRGYDWEKLEPPPRPITTPITNPDTIQEPMDAVFEEVWCPLIAESADKLGVAPSSIQYLTDADIVREKLKDIHVSL